LNVRAERPKIVISAVNLVEGGTLSVLQDCLFHAATKLSGHYQVVALVNQKSLFNFPQIDFIEYPRAKQNWFLRLYHEYWLFRELSKKLDAELWLSLHDMTPNVIAKHRAVYCHNPAPFYSLSLREIWIEPIFAIFNLLYRWAYWVNIHKNDYVIVQQKWMRREFQSMFGIRNILIAHPEVPAPPISRIHLAKNKNLYRFIYPAFPRVFKNFEVICEASKKLLEYGVNNFEVILTIDGTESRYAKSILKKYRGIVQLKFVGRQSRKNIYGMYESADCLIFPSKLETWGLPISEFKFMGRPILAADLEYAHETVGSYLHARFFDPNDPEELSKNMLSVINHNFIPSQDQYSKPDQPYAQGWKELFDFLLTQK
jgi:glycosyltransferase involved in cell wall biosynthesis